MRNCSLCSLVMMILLVLLCAAVSDAAIQGETVQGVTQRILQRCNRLVDTNDARIAEIDRTVPQNEATTQGLRRLAILNADTQQNNKDERLKLINDLQASNSNNSQLVTVLSNCRSAISTPNSGVENTESLNNAILTHANTIRQQTEDLKYEKIQYLAEVDNRLKPVNEMKDYISRVEQADRECQSRKAESQKRIDTITQEITALQQTITNQNNVNDQRAQIITGLKNEQAKTQAEIAQYQSVIDTQQKNCAKPIIFESCADIKQLYPSAVNGIYSIYIGRISRQPVLCDFNAEPAVTVITQRESADVNFTRGIYDYTNGFGDATTDNYFIGLDKISRMTQKLNNLRITVRASTGTRQYYRAYYSGFSVAGASSNFRLTSGKYQSAISTAQDALTAYNQIQFSTFDRRGQDVSAVACSTKYGGGWWWKTCANTTDNPVNIFGLYNALFWSGLGRVESIEVGLY